MTFILLLLIYVTPTPWGSNAMWLKVALMGLLVLLMSYGKIGKLSRYGMTILALVVGGLDLILLGGLFSGQYAPFILFGSQEHVAGWLPMVTACALCVLYWLRTEERTEALTVTNPQNRPKITTSYQRIPYPSKAHNRLAWLFIAVVFVCAFLVKIKGWDITTSCIASKLGIGELMAIVIPVLVMVGVREHYRKINPWLATLAILALPPAAIILVKTGCRSALLGAACGVLVFMVWERRSQLLKWVIGSCAISGLVVSMWLFASNKTHGPTDDSMWNRIARVNPEEMGDGPRIQLLGQFWDNGTPLFGWGPEQGRWTITQNLTGVREDASFDSFHFWPADVVSMGGWLMVPIMATLAWVVLGCAWRNQRNIRVVGYVGGLVAFTVCAAFNPPSLMQLMTAGLLVGGIVTIGSTTEVEQ